MDTETSESRKIRLEHLAILVSLGWSLSYQYHIRVGLQGAAVDLHNEIRRGVALSPYRYRVFVPFLAEQLSRITRFFVEPGQDLAIAYRAYQVAAICFSLVALYLYFRTLFTDDRALIGALIAAGTMGFTFQDHYYQPWSLMEPGIVALGLLLIRLDKRLLLTLLVPVAALNRETAIMIPLAFVAVWTTGSSRPGGSTLRRQDVLFALGLLIEWGAVFYGLRVLLGSAPQIDSIGSLWVTNTAPVYLSASEGRIAMFLGAIWVLALLGYSYSPPFVTRTAVLIPFYLALTFTFSLWWEVRLLMPLYALLIPLSLFYVFRERESPRPIPDDQMVRVETGEDAPPIGQTVAPPVRYPSRRQRKQGRV